MERETVLGALALAWLIASFLAMSRVIQRGRDLCDALEMRDPETYEALGRPRPTYFENPRRTRFARFVSQREYETLRDGALRADFEAYRKHEARIVVTTIASAVAIASLAAVLHFVA